LNAAAASALPLRKDSAATVPGVFPARSVRAQGRFSLLPRILGAYGYVVAIVDPGATS